MEDLDRTGRTSANGPVRWQVWLLLAGFLLSLVIAGVFVYRAVHVASTLHHQEPIRPWMTLHYVARAYRVSPSVLYQALGLPYRPRDRRPISEIAREQHRPVQAVIGDLQRAIAEAPSPSPPPTPTRSAP